MKPLFARMGAPCIGSFIAAACLCTAGFAQEQSEGQRLAGLSFLSVDLNGNEQIDMGEMEQFGGDVFVSMDYDDNQSLSLDEFLSWGYGFENFAEDEDKALAYRTALRVVFSFWDRNADGGITRGEQRQAVIRDFLRADLDGDALLSQGEFLGGFSIMSAVRAALAPEDL
ncbi:MAG: signal transduction protein [Rhodobacteraceae bacterium]|nr:signal transduction protein [Paracoccaceae bacterium]